MCTAAVMAVAQFAISAASGAMSFVGQQQQAKIQDALYEQNRLNAQTAYEDTVRARGHQQAQEQDSTAAEKFDTALEARSARATNAVAADQNGVSGFTVDGLMRDMYAQEGRYDARVDQNTEWSLAQLQETKRAAGYEMVKRTNEVSPGQKPSFMNLGLQIAGQGLNASSTYLEYKNRYPRS